MERISNSVQNELDRVRLAFLFAQFESETEVWLDQHDLELLGNQEISLKAGERVSSESGQIMYSAEWL